MSATAPAPGSSSSVPLSKLHRKDRATIVHVSLDQGSQIAQRLADLGFEPGRTIEVGRRAPLGDPTVYRVADYEISLRRRDADLVQVEVSA